jgi:hypothetical protein
MKYETRTPVKAVVMALAVSLAASGIALPVNAAEKADTELDSVTYSGWGDPAMAQIAVDSGRALIDHLTTARTLLDSEKIEQARSALLASKEFAGAIVRVMPYLTVVEEMMDAGDRVVEDKVDALKTDLLPIYASLDELAVFAPEAAQRTRGMIKQAQKHAEAGDKARAVKELKEAADEVSQHTVYLPVEFVQQQVRVARHALDQKQPDVKTAKTAVQRALDSLVVVVDSVVQTASR